MATVDLLYNGLISNTGWVNVADVQTSNDVRATSGDKGDTFIIDLDPSPTDYAGTNSGNTLTLKIEARVTGAISRTRNLQVELVDAANVAVTDSGGSAIQFTTADITSTTDADFVSGTFTLADDYLETSVDDWRLRLTSLEGGGMADSATIEIDFLRATLDYDVGTGAAPLRRQLAVLRSQAVNRSNTY